MTGIIIFADVEALVKAWLTGSAVGPLVTRADDGGVSIFLAMPSSSPLPAVVLSRVGGAPAAAKDLPQDVARVTFQCWGKSRAQASAIAYALISELDALSRTGGYTQGAASIVAAEVLACLWLPDPQSDTARYVVDALMTVVTA